MELALMSLIVSACKVADILPVDIALLPASQFCNTFLCHLSKLFEVFEVLVFLDKVLKVHHGLDQVGVPVLI